MHALHVALQEGFSHDEVAVSLDGEQLYHGDDISTRQQIGIAGSFDAQVNPGTHAIEVRLPRRGALRRIRSLSVRSDTWLGIALRADGICDIRISVTPFGYL
jgi:hypothetical protein